MRSFWQDLRYGTRMLASNRGFTLAAVFTLALGIGAVASGFGFVQSILLQPLPFVRPNRLVAICESNPEKDRGWCGASPNNLADWEKMSHSFEAFGAWRDWRFTLKGPEGAEGAPTAIASGSFFPMLGVKARLGRVLQPSDDAPGHNHVVVLSSAYWQKRFGGDEGIVGRELRLDDELYTVVGVLPKSFDTPQLGWYGIWAPHTIDPDLALPGRWLRNRRVFARLKDGVGQQAAEVEMKTIAAGLARAYPKDDAGWSVRLVPLRELEVGSARLPLMIFLGAVGCLLLIACVNVANLLLARGLGRQRELAVRASLGADRLRLVRQLLTESVLLALLGGLLGLLVAAWGMDLLVALDPHALPRMEQVHMSGAVYGFALLLSVATGALFGLLPALQTSRVSLSEALKEGSRSSTSSASSIRLRSALLAAEVALALPLLAGAGLLLRTFVTLQNLPLGFDSNHLLALQVFLPIDRYPKETQVMALYERARAELAAIPGVQSVGATSGGPMFGGPEITEFTIAGRSAKEPGKNPTARYFNTSPDYFRTMHIPILKGREFTAQDAAQAPAVAVINERMARRYWPTEDPIGQQIRLVNSPVTLEIVGVVGNTRSLYEAGQVEPEIYYSYLQRVRWASYFLLRTASAPSEIVPEARQRLAALDPNLLTTNVQTMDTLISGSLEAPRFRMLLVGIFAGIAVLLAAVGVYSVLAYAVAQRTHEFGVRMALGADRGKVFRLVLKQGMAPAATGVAIGLAASLAVTQFLQSLLFGVKPLDPLTFAGVILLLLAVAMLACYVPAQRATRVHPSTALRYE